MSNATTNRNRWIPATPKPPLVQVMEFMSRPDVWARIGLCLLTTTILFVVMFGWDPPFPYRVGQAPLRDLHARTAFLTIDYKATDEERDRVRRSFLCYYSNDQQPLEQLRQSLIGKLFEIKQKEFAEISESDTWSKFFPPGANDDPNTAADEESFNLFRDAIADDKELAKVRQAVKNAFVDINKTGLLANVTHEIGQGNLQEIEVFPKGNLQGRVRVDVSDVRIAEVSDDLKLRIFEELGKESETITESKLVAERIFDWLKPELPVTLTWDEPASQAAADTAVRSVKFATKTIEPGYLLELGNSRTYETRGIKAGIPLDSDHIALLRAEYRAIVRSESVGTKCCRSIMFFGLFAAVFSLVCQYLYFRDPQLLDDLKQFALLLGLMLITLTFAWIVSILLGYGAEIVPITVFSMTIAIAYRMELALLLGVLVSIAFTIAHGFDVGEFVTLMAASSTAAMMCRSIRSRTKLVNVGMVVAAVVGPTAIGINFLMGQPMSWSLVINACWFAGGAGFAGLLMTVLLPPVERWFDIQTDLSLLELSDANHPLLKELVQRAPGTYNHSINVASLGEAAADAIGANGLLCRVGAYFHDVGKLRKPEYFIENQAGGENKHDDLLPSMSTLVIIAHVKDGAEIARKHRLPRRILDLIEQHHGTTRVEYFYRRALQQHEELDDAENATPIDEADFRYPGPKPQTPEAAVVMLADAVESASRALREPAPARIEALVQEIAKKKFDDHQFDECNITIQQLNTIQESLIKSLNATYHARIQYPEQQSA